VELTDLPAFPQSEQLPEMDLKQLFTLMTTSTLEVYYRPGVVGGLGGIGGIGGIGRPVSPSRVDVFESSK